MLTHYMQRAEQCMIVSGVSFRLISISGCEGGKRVSVEVFAISVGAVAQRIGNK